MGTNTGLHVGYYIVAKMKKIMVTEKDVQCSHNPKHHIKGDENFCGKCGAKVVDVSIEVRSFLSLRDVESLQTNAITSMEDLVFLQDNFSGIVGEWVGFDKEGYERVALNDFSEYVDCDNEGVHELPDPYTDERRGLPDLDRLQRIMQYESIELKWGALVSVA